MHLWCADLDRSEESLAQLRALLSDDERHRADRFRIGSLRDRFVAGRGMLRAILGKYLQMDPANLRLNYRAHGKPELAPIWKARGLEFNVSHSNGLAMFAFTRGREIGVDVESIRPMPNAAGILERFFSAEEVAQWQCLPPEQQLQAFFHGWTCKEAWIKAVGSGLSFPLSEFCVSLSPLEPARVLSIQGDPRRAAEWWLESYEPRAGFVAAVAVHGEPQQVMRWQFGE